MVKLRSGNLISELQKKNVFFKIFLYVLYLNKYHHFENRTLVYEKKKRKMTVTLLRHTMWYNEILNFGIFQLPKKIFCLSDQVRCGATDRCDTPGSMAVLVVGDVELNLKAW